MNIFDTFAAVSLTSTTLLLVKVTLILFVAWTSHALLRHSNPRWRILLWRVSVIGLICIAMFSLKAPFFTLPLLPALSTETVATNPVAPTVSTNASKEGNVNQSQSSDMSQAGADVRFPWNQHDQTSVSPTAVATTTESAASTTRGSESTEPGRVSRFEQIFSRPTWRLSTWALILWSVGVLLGLVRLFVGVVRVAKTCNASHAVPARVESEVTRIAAGVPHAGAMLVKQCEAVTAPCSVGFLHNTILLPSAMCEKGRTAELRATLAHEIAHFAENDLRWNHLLHVVSVMLWFHPLAWRIRLAHADDCDQRCDATAANCLEDVEGYGRLLAKIALQTLGRTPATALPMARGSSVARRIEMLRSEVGKHRLPRWKARIASTTAVAMLLIVGALGISRSVAQPAAEQKQETKPVLSGRIVDDSGAPVTDATINLTGTLRRGDFLINSFEAKTDAEGRYAFKVAAQKDTYRIRITSEKWVGLTNYRQLPQVQLSLESAMVRDFRLQRACSIRIRTVNEAGDPVRNVRIYTASLAVERFSNSGGVGTDKEGWATIGGLKPSATEYIFGTMNDDYAFAKLIRKLDDPAAQPEEVIVLSKGVDVSGIAICSDGKPAAGWKIKAMPDWWHFGVSSSGAEIAEDGSFTLPHVSKGKYDVTVSVLTSDGTSRQEPVLSDVALPPENDRLDVRLRIPSLQSMTAITGKISTSGLEFRQPITVMARSEDRKHWGHGTIPPGEREFRLSPLPPGRYTLTFQSTEIEQKKVPNIKAPSDDLQVELRVTGQPRLVGSVVRADTKEPLSRFRIRVLKVGYLRGPGYVQDTQWRAIENTNGEFAVDVVGPGIYQVVAAADNFAMARSEPINTDDYQGESLTLEMSDGVTLTGTVVDEEGKPVDGATVTPLSHSSGTMRGLHEAFSGQEGAVKTTDGRFTFYNIPPGKEMLKITHPDYGSALGNEIKIGEDNVDLEPIVITRGGTVRGHVYDATGQPAENITLYFQDQSGRTRLATVVTDQEGYYEAHHLPEQMCNVVRTQQWDDLGVVLSAILPVDGETQQLNLGGKQAVTGRMLVDGEPLRNAKIQLGGENPRSGIFKAFAQSDANGAFTFWGPAHGRRFLYYGAPESRNDWIRASEVSIEASTNKLGDINVRSMSLTVTVTGLSEEQAAGSRLSLIEYDPIWAHGNDVGVAAPRQNAGDSFVFNRVPPGTYELICRRADNLTLRKVIDVDRDNLQQQFSLPWPEETGTLEVQMDQSISGPSRFNPPNLWSDDRRLHAKLYSREGNEVSFEHLPAGKYYLADKDTRDAPRVLEFSVFPDETKVLHLTSESYASQPMRFGFLVLRCFTEQGVPLTGCDVTFGSKGNNIKRNSAQSERQTFIGEPGDYMMSVSFPGYETVNRQVTLHQVAPDGKAVGGFKIDIRMIEEQ